MVSATGKRKASRKAVANHEVREPPVSAYAYKSDELASIGSFLYNADCRDVLDKINAKYPDGRFSMIFSDPPYFLSNGGITCQSGKAVSVNKGKWDRSSGIESNDQFHFEWLERCQKALTQDGTMWVSGTMHAIYSIGNCMQKLGFKILNDIVWEKPNPPPNLACRYFTHSTETIIWAAKNKKSRHVFNYGLMKQANGGKQMKSVWRMYPPAQSEKIYGKHPTQKPVALVERCILASTNPGDIVLDPFAGSSTTGVAAIAHGRRYVGIEQDSAYCALSVKRMRDAASRK